MKEYAIRENHLFVKCYNKGKRYITPCIRVFVLKDLKAEKIKKENPKKEYLNRIGFSANVKIGGAVQRNRCKRVMREAFRRIKKERTLATGKLIVISAREDCVKASSKQVYFEMRNAFEKLGLTDKVV